MNESIFETALNEESEIKKTYTISLSDGTKIENLKLNGNNFISKSEISPSIFEGNLDSVDISDGENVEHHQNMDLVQVTKMGEEWWFILRELSEDELERARIRADIDFLAMMTDVEI